MKIIKRILIGLFTCSLFCTTLLAVQYLDEMKLGMSSFISDGNISLIYNSAQNRLEANSEQSDSTASIFIAIDSNYLHKSYQYLSFEFNNNSEDDLELGATYTFGSEMKLEDGATVLMQQGNQYIFAYAQEGLFRVPAKFEGRIFLPFVDTKETLQQLNLISRNKKGFADYYVTKFRLINLMDEDLINDFMKSKFTVDEEKVYSTLDDKYDLTYLSDENTEIFSNGIIGKVDHDEPTKISMTIKEHSNAVITTVVDFNTIAGLEKKVDPIPVPEAKPEPESPGVDDEILNEEAEALVKLNIPDINEVKMLVNSNSLALKTNVIVFTQLGVAIMIAFFILGIIYLVYLGKKKDD